MNLKQTVGGTWSKCFGELKSSGRWVPNIGSMTQDCGQVRFPRVGRGGINMTGPTDACVNVDNFTFSKISRDTFYGGGHYLPLCPLYYWSVLTMSCLYSEARGRPYGKILDPCISLYLPQFPLCDKPTRKSWNGIIMSTFTKYPKLKWFGETEMENGKSLNCWYSFLWYMK